MKKAIAWAPALAGMMMLLSVFYAVSRAGARRPEQPATPASSTQTLTTEIEASTPIAETVPEHAVFLVLSPDGDPAKIFELLAKYPELKFTCVIPPHYFEAEPRKSALSKFAMFQSSQQIEVALTLENEPMLPLLGDLSLAAADASKPGVEFAWPSDIAAQIARASGKHQKRWGRLPSGLYPPYLALSEQVIDSAKRFRLNYILGKPSTAWGIKFFGGTALLISPATTMLELTSQDVDSWADEMVRMTLERPFVLVDAASQGAENADTVFVEALARKLSKFTETPLVTGETFVDGLRHEYELPSDADPFADDFTRWLATPQQKRAWSAIAGARSAIDAYQRSGRANLQRLDAAIEELCTAESGEFLLMLGQNPASTSLKERDFLATISNVYRLCEAPIPANMNTWFASRTWQKASNIKYPENDRPFFVEGPQSLTWNDPKADDNGSGKYVYPSGPYPKGMFDLREVTISWSDTEVTVSASTLERFESKPTNIVPLLDVYIDLNRLPDAGSTAPLRKRGNALILRDAAWEYALSISPAAAFLYQAVPGGTPRVIELKDAEVHGNTITASFSRKYLRGDPRRWRLSAGLLGTETSRRQDEQTPAGITTMASEKSFGGAATPKLSPYIDLLSPSIDDQVERISANESGAPLQLPYVEAQ